MSVAAFRRMLLFGQVQNGLKFFEKRGFHQGRVLYFMHERHPNVEENRKRIGIVGGSICAGQVSYTRLKTFIVKGYNIKKFVCKKISYFFRKSF